MGQGEAKKPSASRTTSYINTILQCNSNHIISPQSFIILNLYLILLLIHHKGSVLVKYYLCAAINLGSNHVKTLNCNILVVIMYEWC